MWKVIKRWWKYLAMKLHVRHEENADPKVQLEQAIQEAKEQHKRLTEQAASVIEKTSVEMERIEIMAGIRLPLVENPNSILFPHSQARFTQTARPAPPRRSRGSCGRCARR